MLKISSPSKQKPKFPEPIKEPEEDTSITNCVCCSTLLTYPQDTQKFKCSVCDTTNILRDHGQYFKSEPAVHLISAKYVTKIINKCLVDANSQGESLHKVFEPLSNYLYNAFRSYTCLNNSFKVKKTSTKIHYSTSNINYYDVRETFNILTQLPTKRPLFNALQGCLALLKRTPITYGEDARNYCWLLILLEIPFLSYSLTHYEKLQDSQSTMIDVQEIKASAYDILKRVLGILSNISSISVKNYIISWVSKYPPSDFIAKIDLINVYITFHLKKYFYIANNPDYKRRVSVTQVQNPTQIDQEYLDNSNIKLELEQMYSASPTTLPLSSMNLERPSSHNRTHSRSKSRSKSKDTTAKIKIFQYGNDWHLKTSSLVLELFTNAYNIRADNLQKSIFYNSLVDYVNIKLDFDHWVSNKKFKDQKPSDTPEILTVIAYITGTQNSYSNSASYFFCKYPFLITLGNKISILEYEAKRIMERKAEEAFINSLDKRVPIDVYFRVKVRRDHIVQDSLSCINLNQANLKKSLKVQFVNEPGIDVGGLRKEWFLLLTKAIFNPQTGVLVNVDESNYHWFNLIPIDNLEIYYLFGAVLGLAIYNSTILELKFPLAFYKILLNIPLGFSDFQMIFPDISRNLFKLKSLSEEELKELELSFEVTVTDIFNNRLTKTLVHNGNQIKVNTTNRDYYIEKYAKFYLVDGISEQITSFLKGFNSVTSGNALTLFSPEEIQLLLCGNEEGKIDLDVLKSITKYVGWNTPEEAIDSNIVKWIWEYLHQLTYDEQKRFLIFVTGSDRIPATGIQNLNFTIKKIKSLEYSRLPIAHTCFNQLDLYEYKSKEQMFDKLAWAIDGSSGFGIK